MKKLTLTLSAAMLVISMSLSAQDQPAKTQEPAKPAKKETKQGLTRAHKKHAVKQKEPKTASVGAHAKAEKPQILNRSSRH